MNLIAMQMPTVQAEQLCYAYFEI